MIAVWALRSLLPDEEIGFYRDLFRAKQLFVQHQIGVANRQLLNPVSYIQHRLETARAFR